MRFELTILGCNSAKPANGRHPTSQVLRIQDQQVLIDCGEGTQLQMNKFGIKGGKIKHIFISHLHGDHIFGLPGLLTSYSLNSRIESLTIFSPKGLKEMIELILKNSGSHLSYPIEFVEVDTTRSYQVFENSVFEVFSIPLVHRVPTSGYLFREKPRPRNIRSEKISEYSIPYTQINAIKEGADFEYKGKRIPNVELTLDPPPIRSFAYCSDTMYEEAIVPIIEGCNLLYHEATYLHEKLDRALWSKHSTALEAAQIAVQAKAGKLIIGHYSSRYLDVTPLLLEAKTVFENTELGEEGKVYLV